MTAPTEDQLLAVYLDGFTTGAASAISSVFDGLPIAVRARFAHRLTEAVVADPAAVETVRVEIQERLAGRDTGVKELALYPPPTTGD